jgi:peptidoglycan/LPS O-acetylase OafA/YrhL
MGTIGFTWLALFYLAFILFALLFPGSWVSHCLRWGWLRGLGIIAYGTYLFHSLFLDMAFGRSPWLKSLRDIGLSFLVLAATLLFCRLSWVFFEKPLVQFGQGKTYQHEAAAMDLKRIGHRDTQQRRSP